MADTPPYVPVKPRVKRLDAVARAQMLAELGGLATVCQAANCPNIGECWQRGTATFMILGEVCTRNCKFCNVASGKPGPPDPAEPKRIAEAVASLKLRFAVLTCVDRDDLADFGAAHWAACIESIHAECPGVGIEALTGDFQGNAESIAAVVRARPSVFAHNVETVPRLQQAIRHPASWERSIAVLKQARAIAGAEGIELAIKSGLMAGLGETDEEIKEALGLLRDAGVELVTIGQYLKPLETSGRIDVQRYASQEQFEMYADWARELGFAGVASSALTRSSHFAETLYAQARGIVAQPPPAAGQAVADTGGAPVPPGKIVAGKIVAQPPPAADCAQPGGLRIYRRDLPHWRMPGAVYWVTWRVLTGRKGLPDEAREVVAATLANLDGKEYRLIAYVVMDDHVHVVVQPEPGIELEKIVQAWKSVSAHRINKKLGQSGALWQPESFDRIVRDDDELLEKCQYILDNPFKRWPEIREYCWVYCVLLKTSGAAAHGCGPGSKTHRPGACATEQNSGAATSAAGRAIEDTGGAPVPPGSTSREAR